MKTKTISERVFNADQSWYFERIILLPNTDKVKINIRRNAYDFQSWARVSRWNGEEWKNVVDAPITEFNCHKISYVDKGITTKHFDEDAGKLLMEAMKIVL